MGKRKQREPAGIPEWMVTFGDMMSLLLCFFIMLFALSTITPIKWEAFVETLQFRMGYEGQSRTPSDLNRPSAAMSSVSELSRRTAALRGGQETPGPAGESLPRQTIRPDGDIVRGGLIRFGLGSDVLDEQAEIDLELLMQALTTSSNKIRVVGYVSPAEEDGGIYSRGIYLAQRRARIVMDYLVSLGLREEYFEIGVSTSIPDRAVLPRGTDPRLAGASAAVYLVNNSSRRPTVEQ
jgi:chemotaxis protein MotB